MVIVSEILKKETVLIGFSKLEKYDKISITRRRPTITRRRLNHNSLSALL